MIGNYMLDKFKPDLVTLWGLILLAVHLTI